MGESSLRLLDNIDYINQLKNISENFKNIEFFRKKTFFITGSTGMICSFLIDFLMYLNSEHNFDIKIYALNRNKDFAHKRFSNYINDKNFEFIEHDINLPITKKFECDFIISGASNSHPIQYASDPIGTISTNVFGLKNVLDFASSLKNCSLMFLSSVEIYGENSQDVDSFDENFCGYIDCNTLRAGYTESKRLCEAMCQAYINVKNLKIIIPRISRVYGPTMFIDDSKALSQFIMQAVTHNDIILKSKGTQKYSYTYVADVVVAMLHLFIHGKNGEAYNVSSDYCGESLYDIAKIIATMYKLNIKFDFKDTSIESKGYSKVNKAILNNNKLKETGWNYNYPLKDGLFQTIKILRDLRGTNYWF